MNLFIPKSVNSVLNSVPEFWTLEFSFRSLKLMEKSKILKVPYFPQYDKKTCQTAVLKMFFQYMVEKRGIHPNQSLNYSINGIREKLESMGNAYAHKIWMDWLKLSLNLETESIYVHHEFTALHFLTSHLNNDYPVIASVSHANNTGGHIILIFGYEQKKIDNLIQHPKTVFHVHDPYGRYDPTFNGKRNIDFGPSAYAYDSVVVSQKNRLVYKNPKDSYVMAIPKGKDLKLPSTSIRRNYSKEKAFRFKRYELISAKTK